MQTAPVFIGIDTSKATLALCVRQQDQRQHDVIHNEKEAIRCFFQEATFETFYIGVENTGRCNWALYSVVQELDLPLYVIAPLHLKKPGPHPGEK